MIVRDLEHHKRRVSRLLAAEHAYPDGDLSHVAAAILARREQILAVVAEQPTPFYLFDRAGFDGALAGFSAAFDAKLPGHRPYYAVKSNHHPFVVEAAAAAGFGLDVSSGRELRQALAGSTCPVVFSGPAKTEAELELAVLHADRVIVHMDSFRELERLGAVSARLGRPITAGVRVSTGHHGAWSKFGVPLADLPKLWRAAAGHPQVRLRGIQFHLSWNRDATPYVRIIEALGRTLASEFTPAERAQIAFIDLGGGFRPHRLEGYFPGDHPIGAVIRAADEHDGEETEFIRPYLIKDSIAIEAYADAIGAAVERHLRPLVDAAYFTEPGRVVSTYAMHIVLTVVDRKSDDLVIVDGGVNMVGWERYLQIYCPVVNLTRPSERELAVRIGGSLCDCEDLWGMRCYAERMEEGDVLVLPYQGAYTFATAQEFIRPISPVIAW